MRASLYAMLLFASACTAAPALVDPPQQGETILLPAAGAETAGAQGVMQDDPRFGRIVRNVTQPTLTAFLPDPAKATGASVIIAPGGGFHMLSIENEGTAVAEWLKEQGVAAFVLRYHLVQTGDDYAMTLIRRLTNRKDLDASVAPVLPLATEDGEAAVRHVKQHAATWGLKPDRVGMIGFSAGGAVAVWGLQDTDAADRPDFVAAIYPGLLPNPIVAPEHAPPLFVVVAKDDAIALGDSERLSAAWKTKGVPVELVTYPSGGHGFGMAQTGKPTDAWREELRTWLDAQGVLTR